MRSHLREKLDDGKTLFNKGGCHVFADELYARLVTHGFTLRRLADANRTSVQFEALHIYVAKGDTIIDVEGIRRETDLIREMEEYRLQHGGPVPDYQAFECSHEELFKPFERDSDSERGIHNRWDYILDEEFVAECRKRASRLISQFPERYDPAFQTGSA